MKKYETPEINVIELDVADVVATSYTEPTGDNDTSWLDKWTSGLNKKIG